MNKVSTFLSGKKTILGVTVGAVYSVLIALGYLPDNQFVWTAIVTWTGISFRLALNK